MLKALARLAAYTIGLSPIALVGAAAMAVWMADEVHIPAERAVWLGFWGGAIGGVMTLLAAIVAWAAVSREVQAQNNATRLMYLVQCRDKMETANKTLSHNVSRLRHMCESLSETGDDPDKFWAIFQATVRTEFPAFFTHKSQAEMVVRKLFPDFESVDLESLIAAFKEICRDGSDIGERRNDLEAIMNGFRSALSNLNKHVEIMEIRLRERGAYIGTVEREITELTKTMDISTR